MKKEVIIQNPVNVQCKNCKCWGWVRWFEKLSDGRYICDECCELEKISMEEYLYG
jgi:hypothetical protein